MKNKVVLFVFGYILLIFSSCLNSDEVEYEVSRDAQISAFSLSHDSISGLSSVKFVIDQVEGLIYNRDSLAFGTDISEKLVASFSFVSAVRTVEVVPQATGDTIYWQNESDSIDFTKPVDIKVTALDGLTSKRYLAKLNVHQVFPDTMLWSLVGQNIIDRTIQEQKVIPYKYNGEEAYFMYTQIANEFELRYAPATISPSSWTELPVTGIPANAILSQIYPFNDKLYLLTDNGEIWSSTDGQQWTKFMDTSFTTFLGVVVPEEGDRNQTKLAGLMKNEADSYLYAAIDADLNVEEGNYTPDNFPVTGSGNFSYSSMYEARLAIVGGLDKSGNPVSGAWMTNDGLVWTQQTKRDYFTPRHGVMVTHYDDKIYLLGGIEGTVSQNKKGTTDIYYSPDRGVSWAVADTTIVMPEEYRGRGYGSIVVDKENCMFIFGGKEQPNGKVLDEIWRGRINRLGFKD